MSEQCENGCRVQAFIVCGMSSSGVNTALFSKHDIHHLVLNSKRITMAFFRKNYLNFQHLDLQIYAKECDGPFRHCRHHVLRMSGTRLTFTPVAVQCFDQWQIWMSSSLLHSCSNSYKPKNTKLFHLLSLL